jgi:bifunctional UDP-N-acetylglucosamine pyrophosphorylase/glucosamine-1-phosphate N-acetyltransferase
VDAILLAGGQGTRMAPLTPSLAKPTLPVAGRPLLHWMLDGLAKAGVRHAAVVTHHQDAAVEVCVRTWGGPIDCVFVPQGRTGGTGHAVAVAAPHVEGDALLVMGDAGVAPSTLKALAANKGFWLAAATVEDARPYGALRVEGDRVLDLAEKSQQPPSNLVNTGLYRVPSEALQQAQTLRPSPRGELEFTDIVRAWAHESRVRWMTAKGWIDLGAPWDLLRAQETVLPSRLDALLGGQRSGGPGTVEPGVQVRGRLWVEPGAVVRSGTYVEGDVYVGPDSRVGPNAFLRGPLCIGAGCHVGAGTELKASLLLDGSNAPHLNYVGDSILGPGVNLGAGTNVANLKVTPGTVRAHTPNGPVDTGRRKFGVVLGPDVKTGINCSLNPGTLVGAGSVFGAGQTVSGWVPPATERLR